MFQRYKILTTYEIYYIYTAVHYYETEMIVILGNRILF